MQVGLRAWLLAILVHAVALAWILPRPARPERSRGLAVSRDLAPSTDPPLTIVELITVDPLTPTVGTTEVRPSVAPRDVGRAASAASAPAVGNASTGSHEVEPEAAPSTAAATSDRSGSSAAETLPDAADVLARIAGLRPGTPAPAPESRWTHDPKIKMVPNGRGTKQIRDVVAIVDIAPDGTVDVRDTPYFTFDLNLPTPATIVKQFEATKRDLAEWAEDPLRDKNVGSKVDLPNHLLAVPGSCDRTSDGMCFTPQDQRRQWAVEDGVVANRKVAGGKADLTGYLGNKLVGDQYASRKLKILDQTREERARLGAEFRLDQLDRAAELALRNLEALWRSTSDPADRRAQLFALWDECAEGEGSAGEAGARARAIIVGWIRSHLPAGSPGAFTADEIATLDARRSSRGRFAPYAD